MTVFSGIYKSLWTIWVFSDIYKSLRTIWQCSVTFKNPYEQYDNVQWHLQILTNNMTMFSDIYKSLWTIWKCLVSPIFFQSVSHVMYSPTQYGSEEKVQNQLTWTRNKKTGIPLQLWLILAVGRHGGQKLKKFWHFDGFQNFYIFLTGL